MYDYAVIGGGVAGCSIAYFLSQNSQNVAIIEQNSICSGASGAAGAFINPTMGRPSNLKSLSDEAFLFSVEYFKKHFSDIFWQCGTYLLPKCEKTLEEFLELQKYIPFSYEYFEPSVLPFLKTEVARFGSYLCRDAGVVEPKIFCQRLVASCSVYENTKVENIACVDGVCEVAGVRAKSVIIASGAFSGLVCEEYIRDSIVGLWGQKIEVESTRDFEKNISGEALISATKDGRFAIGATYVRSKIALDITQVATSELIKTAGEMIVLGEARVVDEKGGLRSTSIDHFPIVGRVIDSKTTLKAHPSIVNGKKIVKEQITYHDNIFIFSGHTSKAFSVAFYTASQFAKMLAGDGQLPKSIDSDRLFFRWCRRGHATQCA